MYINIVVIIHYTYMSTIMGRLLQLIYTGVLSNYIRIDMPQYRGIFCGITPITYMGTYIGNKLALRSSGVQLIVQGNICVEIICLSLFSHIFFSISNLHRVSNYWQHVIMKEPLFVNIIFDMQYTEIKYFLTIEHALNTIQNVIHIWIISKVYTTVFYSIPYLEEQISQMSYIRAVDKEVADVINFITVWALVWCFYFHIE